MELPKHTTQVGTIAANKKLYLEDYCVSYMKQLGEMYPEDRKQIALFGVMEKERSVEYALVYGAALLGMGKGRTDSLTNSQKEEAESFREEYFPDYQLLGVVIATDAVDENVYWLGNGNKAIPLDGYYIFYERNEAMLNFMMHNQKEERGIDLDPVIVKKADMDRERREKKEKEEQEMARREAEKKAEKKSGSYRQKLQKTERMARPADRRQKHNLFPAAACLLLLAIVGIYGIKQQGLQSGIFQPIGAYVSGLWEKASVFTSGYLGNQLEETSGESQFLVNNDTKETEILNNEAVNNGAVTTEGAANNSQTSEKDIPVVSTEIQPPAELDVIVIPDPDKLEGTGTAVVDNTEQTNATEGNQGGVLGGNPGETPAGNPEGGNQSVGNSANTLPENQEGSQIVNPPQNQTVTGEQEIDTSQKYLIKKGDSLLRILRAHYGDESRLNEICSVNGIADPNNIQVGQIILLP